MGETGRGEGKEGEIMNALKPLALPNVICGTSGQWQPTQTCRIEICVHTRSSGNEPHALEG